jgi:hypothetical protein
MRSTRSVRYYCAACPNSIEVIGPARLDFTALTRVGWRPISGQSPSDRNHGWICRDHTLSVLAGFGYTATADGIISCEMS